MNFTRFGKKENTLVNWWDNMTIDVDISHSSFDVLVIVTQ